MRGIHRWAVNSPHNGPVTRKMFPFDDVIMIMYSTAITTSEHAAYLTSHKTSHTPHVRANRMSITVIVEKIYCIITTLDCFSAPSVSITGICYLSPEGFSDVDTFLTVIQCHHPPIIRQNQGHTECTVAGIYSCIGLNYTEMLGICKQLGNTSISYDICGNSHRLKLTFCI